MSPPRPFRGLGHAPGSTGGAVSRAL